MTNMNNKTCKLVSHIYENEEQCEITVYPIPHEPMKAFVLKWREFSIDMDQNEADLCRRCGLFKLFRTVRCTLLKYEDAIQNVFSNTKPSDIFQKCREQLPNRAEQFRKLEALFNFVVEGSNPLLDIVRNILVHDYPRLKVVLTKTSIGKKSRLSKKCKKSIRKSLCYLHVKWPSIKKPDLKIYDEPLVYLYPDKEISPQFVNYPCCRRIFILTYSFAKLDIVSRSGTGESTSEDWQEYSLRGKVPVIRFDNRFLPTENEHDESETLALEMNQAEDGLENTTVIGENKIRLTTSRDRVDDLLIDLRELDESNKDKTKKKPIHDDTQRAMKKRELLHRHRRTVWQLDFGDIHINCYNKKYIFYDEASGKYIYGRGRISENRKGLYYVRVSRVSGKELQELDSRESKKMAKEWKVQFKNKALETYYDRWRQPRDNSELYEKIAKEFRLSNKGSKVLQDKRNIKRYIEQDDIPNNDEDFRVILSFIGINDPQQQNKYINSGKERNRQRRNNGRDKKLKLSDLINAVWKKSEHGEMECFLGEFNDRHCVRYKIVNVKKIENNERIKKNIILRNKRRYHESES